MTIVCSRTVFVKDNTKLPPAKDRRKGLAAQSSRLSFLKGHRAGLFDHRNATTKSMPTSPALGATTAQSKEITSIPGLGLGSGVSEEETRIREALKTALIHLLAVRPVSEKFIKKTLACSKLDLNPLLAKYGRPTVLDPDKYDLSDNGFKELDVWTFKYNDPNDRASAIERAVKNYDRKRISREEKVWQMLLPKAERGKGKILSKLQLHGGIFQGLKGPRINVESTDENKKAAIESTGTDSDDRQGRLAPGEANSTVRSRSQDPIKKKRVSEKEAQSKRLFSKNTKKAAQTAQFKAVKQNTRKEPKEPKKAVATTNPKVKSAEFVHDSDDDVDMVDVGTTKSTHQKLETEVSLKPVTSKNPAPRPTEKKPEPKKTESKKRPRKEEEVDKSEVKKPRLTGPEAKKMEPRPSEKGELKKPRESDTKQAPSSSMAGKKLPAPTPSSNPSTHRQSDASSGSTAMTRTLSHKRTSSSPVKPSPLGSSPPTNASDLDLDLDKLPLLASSSSNSNSPALNAGKDLASTNVKTLSRATVPSPNGSSDRTLKRKANDLDSDIHRHSSHPSDRPAKRHQPQPQPPASQSQITPPVSDRSSSTSPTVSVDTLAMAQNFKLFYEKYAKMHHELAAAKEPDEEKVNQLVRMRERLKGIKKEIEKSVKN